MRTERQVTRMPGYAGATWRLYRAEELVGVLEVDDIDQPWLQARFTPRPGFAPLRVLFDHERELLDREPFDEQAFEAAWEQLAAQGVRLTHPDGRPVAEFLLHIDGDRAWFRYSDTPFDKDG